MDSVDYFIINIHLSSRPTALHGTTLQASHACSSVCNVVVIVSMVLLCATVGCAIAMLLFNEKRTRKEEKKENKGNELSEA